MSEIFPSILPSKDQAERKELLIEWEYTVLRKIISELDTDAVTGKSTQIEMADWIVGHYNQQELEQLREAGQKDAQSDRDTNEHIKEAIENL